MSGNLIRSFRFAVNNFSGSGIVDVVVEVSTMDFPTVEVTVEVVEEVPLQINFQLLKLQLEL